MISNEDDDPIKLHDLIESAGLVRRGGLQTCLNPVSRVSCEGERSEAERWMAAR